MAAQPDRVLDRLMPVLLAAMALMGAYHGQEPLVAAALALLLTLLATRLWSRHSLDSLQYERQISDDRAFPGDELLLTLRLTNQKPLPLPWVEVDDRVPWQAVPATAEGSGGQHQGRSRLRLAGSALWYERVTWRCRLRCQRRGIYRLGPAVVTSGDPFGFFPCSARLGEMSRLVVYPRLIPLERLGLPAHFPLGDSRARRWIFEDPSRTVGVRDYRPEDPFRRIHWKATARRQHLQVKLQEPTTTLETAIFLAVDTFKAEPRHEAGETGGRGDAENQGIRAREPGLGTESPEPGPQGSQQGPGSGARNAAPCPGPRPLAPDPWSQDSAPGARHSALEFEHAVSVAASLAHHLIQERHPVGLYVNGGIPGSTDSIQIPPGCSQEQLARILEALAGVEPLPNTDITLQLADVGPRLPWGSSVVVVMGSLPETTLSALQALRRRGQNPVVLLVGEGEIPEGSGVVAICRVDGGGR